MKFKFFLITVLLIAASGVNAWAQENPCGGTGDPDDFTTCPLDNWVAVLVVAALAFVTISLYRNQKSQTAQ